MKNIKFLLILVLAIGLLSGCSSILLETDSEIGQLKEDLSILAQKNAKEYFKLEMDLKKFDISLGKEVGDNQFENLKTSNTRNKLYLIGHHKNKPEDIISFVLVYDSENEKILKFGVQTIDDEEMVYANLDESN